MIDSRPSGSHFVSYKVSSSSPLGASLRRPWETSYPMDERIALAHDETLSDVLADEFLRTRVVNLLKNQPRVYDLNDITQALKENQRKVLSCVSDLAKEGMISRIYKDRTPYYAM